jgi:hypothetical protein
MQAVLVNRPNECLATRPVDQADVEAVARPAPEHVEHVRCASVGTGQGTIEFVGREQGEIHRMIEAPLRAECIINFSLSLLRLGLRR